MAAFFGVAFFAAAFFGAAALAGAGALRFLVTRPVLVLPNTFSVSVTAGACKHGQLQYAGLKCQDKRLRTGAAALRLLAVLAAGLPLAPGFFVVAAFFGAAALVAFLGAPTFFFGAASLAAVSFFVAVF